MKNKVRQARISKGFTQQQLANKIGVGRSTISNIETSVHLPSVDIAIRLALALNTTVEYLFYLDNFR